MGKVLDEILKEFFKLAFEGQFSRGEKLVVGKVEQSEVDRDQLVSAILGAGTQINDSEMFEKLQKYTIASYCFQICMKINLQKQMRQTIQNLVAIAYTNLGATLHESKKFKEAETYFREALENDPNSAITHGNLGITLDSLGRLEEAEASYREAIKINPNYAAAYSNLGTTLDKLGRLEEAEASYREAIKINPNCADAHNGLGTMLDSLGRLEEAEASYREAIKINPKFSEAYYNLGITLGKMKKLQEAEKSFKEALKINPKFAKAQCNLGIALDSLGRFEEAEESFREAIKINPKFAKAHNDLGTTLDSLGRFEEAEESYREAIKINPKFSEAYYNLGITLGKMKKLQEAEKSFKEALKINPNYAEAHANLGVILHVLRRLQEAEASYRKAIEIEPNYAEAHANLGILLFGTDKPDEAKLQFNIARKSFVERNSRRDATYVAAFISWTEGWKSWQTGILNEAEKRYVEASESFRVAEREVLGSTLNLIIEYFRIDKEYSGYMKTGNLIILQKGILNLSREIQRSLHKLGKLPIPEVEILHARAISIQFLKNTLLFKSIKREQLDKARRIFSKHHFPKAYEGLNAIDTFRNYLNHFCPNKSLSEISEEKEKELFTKLNPAIGLDGVVTQQFAKVIANHIKPELCLSVTRPIIKEERKTRKILTKRIGKIEEKLETIHVILSGVEKEITIKRLAYSEFEIVFPTPLGIYKIHIPAGAMTTQDTAKIKVEISKVLIQATEKARQTSAKLHSELQKKKQEIARKILTKLKKLRKLRV